MALDADLELGIAAAVGVALDECVVLAVVGFVGDLQCTGRIEPGRPSPA